MSMALRLFVIALAVLVWAPLLRAAAPADAVTVRARALIPFLNGKAAAASHFAPSFLAEIPAAKIAALAARLRTDLGVARHVASARPENENAGTVAFVYDRGVVTMRIVIASGAPRLITGLLVTNSRRDGDTFAKLEADFSALPGKTGFSIARLGGAKPEVMTERHGDAALAIGSGFKLYVLAELTRAIGAGERQWSDVVPLMSRSLASGILQDWPVDAPVSLHTLAALMISRSDNTATDRLIDLLGRARVEAVQALAGHSDPARNQPFLTTGELFLLKGTGGKVLLQRWIAGDTTARRALLAELAMVDRARFDYGSFSGPPVAIETAEWFATPNDLVRALDWIRTSDLGTARAILAINPGIGTAAAADYFYLGFKGGSEVGVVNMSFLVQAKGGAWYAVTGSWNDPENVVDEDRFVGLMSRAVALAAK